MALERKISICIACGEIVIEDTTGVYDADTNPGGYGGPNPDFADATAYTVAVYAPGATEPAATLDLLLSPPAPDADGHYVYTLTAAQLGFTEQEIVSGVWSVDVTWNTEVEKRKVLAMGDIMRKIRKCICCNSKKHTWMNLELKAAAAQHRCFKHDKAQKTIDRLYRAVAKCCDCDDCN